MRFARITGLSGQPTSGLWQLHLDDAETGPCTVHFESGHGARVIAGCFGGLDHAIGQEIFYHADDLGLLVAFTPAAEMEE
jgi:hypothetical protein